MKDFIEKIRKVYPLSDEALSLFIAETERVSFPKGHLLIRSDVKEKYSYFIIKGYARGFFYKEDRDVTICLIGYVVIIDEWLYVWFCRI